MTPDEAPIQLDLSRLDAASPLEPGLARYLSKRGVQLGTVEPPPAPTQKDQHATFFLSITGTPESVAESLLLLFDPPFGCSGEACGG